VNKPRQNPVLSKKYRKSLFKRILDNSEISETGCWEWTRNLDACGYGKIGVKRGTGNCVREYSHRAIFFAIGVQIPDGLLVDHKCRNRACCNPGHLRFVTRAQNTIENSLSGSALNKGKTHCVRGHEFID